MKSVVPLILALSVSICEASPTENPVPWVEKKAHTAKEGQLFSTRCLTPESSFYISYSVYPKYDSRGESNKKEFAQGFYTYRPPERIVREMKTFSNHDRTPYAKTGRYCRHGFRQSVLSDSHEHGYGEPVRASIFFS